MSTEVRKTPTGRFPLRLMPSVRHHAEFFSAKEGVSLNQFINVAVAEKLAQLRQEEWMRKRTPLTDAEVAEGMRLLDKAGLRPTETGDELPKGYRSIRERRNVGGGRTRRDKAS